MHPRPSRRQSLDRALTLTELTVLIGICALLFGLILPELLKSKMRGRGKAQRIACLGNLKITALASLMWKADHADRFPWQVPTNGWGTNSGGTLELIPLMSPELHWRAMSNELATPVVLTCPADTSRRSVRTWSLFTRRNLSYFVNVEASDTSPMAVLAGDRNLVLWSKTVAPGLVVLASNSIVGWDKNLHGSCGNVALADGSVHQTSSTGLVEVIRRGLATNRLVIP